MHLTQNEDMQTHYNILQKWKKILQNGNEKKMKFTIPPFIFILFKFIYKLDAAQKASHEYYENHEGEEPEALPDVTVDQIFREISEMIENM